MQSVGVPQGVSGKLKEQVKSGSLDDTIREKIEIFEEYLGKDTDKKKQAAKYEAMVQFGLNLASSRGGNLMEKIATSAKDPLSNYAKVGKEILNRAEKIKEAGILNYAPIKNKWAEHLSGERNWQYHIWDILIFQAWSERWL